MIYSFNDEILWITTCKVVIYNIVFCWLIFRAKFDCNVIQSFVPCIYCGISL